MAADTAQKRFSLLGLGSPTPRLLPIPEGSFSADDRALLLFLYNGIALGEVVIPPAVAETYSGGWGRAARTPFRDESDGEREARIKLDRIRLGIYRQIRLSRPPEKPLARRSRGYPLPWYPPDRQFLTLSPLTRPWPRKWPGCTRRCTSMPRLPGIFD